MKSISIDTTHTVISRDTYIATSTSHILLSFMSVQCHINGVTRTERSSADIRILGPSMCPRKKKKHLVVLCLFSVLESEMLVHCGLSFQNLTRSLYTKCVSKWMSDLPAQLPGQCTTLPASSMMWGEQKNTPSYTLPILPGERKFFLPPKGDLVRPTTSQFWQLQLWHGRVGWPGFSSHSEHRRFRLHWSQLIPSPPLKWLMGVQKRQRLCSTLHSLCPYTIPIFILSSGKEKWLRGPSGPDSPSFGIQGWPFTCNHTISSITTPAKGEGLCACILCAQVRCTFCKCMCIHLMLKIRLSQWNNEMM